jgi:short-subunit dehydrogenase
LTRVERGVERRICSHHWRFTRFGDEVARALAERHYNLVLVARSAEPLHAFAAELRRSAPVAVVAIQVDLSVCGAGQILAEQLARGGIPVELLVNNAGFGLRGEFRDLSLPRQLEMLRLNNQAIVELTYSLLPRMLRRVIPRLVAKRSRV